MSSVSEYPTRHTPDEVVPMDHVLRNVVDSVLEEEPITVTKHWSPISFFKADLVNAVAPRQFFRVLWKFVKVFPGEDISVRLPPH